MNSIKKESEGSRKISKMKKKIGRPKKTHGAYAIQAPKDKQCRAFLREIETALFDDLGGQNNATNKQRLQVVNALRLIHKLYLIDIWLNDQPAIISPSGELLPVISNSYLGFVNALSRILQSLGLKDRAERTGHCLESYLQAKHKGIDNE